MSPEASSASSSDFTRLHISPLDPDLLKIVLPASVASQARNVSYHTIETFPERRYGFVELPVMEAEKIKKKLNGAVLKGTKLKIEKARPEERVEPTGELDKEDEKKSKKKSKVSTDGSRKRKRDRDVVDGVTLTDRKVKRGWTEPADQRRKKSKKEKEKEKDGKHTEKKKRQKSKYTEQEECLLKTKVPPNAVANISEDSQPRKRKKKGKSREVTVHEFEKTTKFPSFLKNSVPEDAPKTAVEYVEDKGWVDEDGEVVETVKTKKVAKSTPKKSKKVTPPPPVEESDDDSTSDSGTSSSGSSSDEDEGEEEGQKPKAVPQKDQDSSSEDSSSDDEDDHDESPQQPEHATPLSAIKADASRPMSSSSSRSLTIKIPPPITPSATKVHPLEALYKRSKPDGDATETPAKEPQPFSFFGGGGDDDDIEEEQHVERTPAPMTPFTRQDIEWRNVRSAAPTPDTAHPSRMRNFWADEQDEDADMADALREAEREHDEDDDEQEAAAPAPGSSDFQAWFWDNRRDLNRSWMKRRKTAAKEKRHRENKARANKAV